MRRAVIFGEDYAHEVVLCALLDRLADETQIPLTIQIRSTTGGHGRVLKELANFLRHLVDGKSLLPDLFVVAIDANCHGYAKRVKEIKDHLSPYHESLVVVAAVPDPHVERWLLIDPRAFHDALGVGCEAPDQKCDRDRYKQLLDNAVRKAGIEPLLGGIEFAEDIVKAMNLDRAARADTSFAHVLRDLRAALRS